MNKALFLAVLIALPLTSFASIDANLRYGSTGTEVSELQEFLVSKGFLTTNPTGNFYSLTLAAVKSYQASVNVPNTGYVGPMTRAAINAELSANLKDSNEEEASLPPTPVPIPSPTPVTPSPIPMPSPTPVFGNVTVAPTISLGEAVCYDSHAGTPDKTVRMIAKVPVSISGTWGGLIYGLKQQGGGQTGSYVITPKSASDIMPFQNLDPGTYDYTVDFYSTPVSTTNVLTPGVTEIVESWTSKIATPIAHYSGTFTAPSCK